MQVTLSPNIPKPHRLAFLAEAKQGSTVECVTEHGTRTWTRQHSDWTRNGESWETRQLAEVLWRLGGDQTLETFGDFELSNLSPEQIAGLRKQYSEAVRATRGMSMEDLTTSPDAVE